MLRRVIGPAAVIAVLATLFGAPAAWAAGPTLTAGPADAAPVVIRLAPDQASGSIVAYLHAGDAATSGTLAIDQLARTDGSPTGSGTISILPRGGKEGDPVALAENQVVAVVIAVADVGASARYSANATLVTPAGDRSIGVVTVERAPAAPFSMLGVTDGSLGLAADSTTSAHRFRIRSAMPDTTTVEVSVGDLDLPSGAAGCVQVVGSPGGESCDRAAGPLSLTLPPGASADGFIVAVLEGEGAYTTTMSLTSGTWHQDVKITLTRTIAAAPFAAASPAPLHIQKFLPGGLDGGDVLITLDPTSLRTFATPTLGILSPFARVEGPILTSPPFQTSFVTPSGDPVYGRPLEYRLRVSTPAAQGTYQATLRAVSPDYAAVTIPITVVVRDSALAALVVVMVGSALGWLTKYWLTRGRPRVQRVVRANALERQVLALRRTWGDDDVVAERIATLGDRVLAVRGDIDADGDPTAIDDTIARLALQLATVDEWAQMVPDLRLLAETDDATATTLVAEGGALADALVSTDAAAAVRPELAKAAALAVKTNRAAEHLVQETGRRAVASVRDLRGWLPQDGAELDALTATIGTAMRNAESRATRPAAVLALDGVWAAICKTHATGLRALLETVPPTLGAPLKRKTQTAGSHLANTVSGQTATEPTVRAVEAIHRAWLGHVAAAVEARRPPGPQEPGPDLQALLEAGTTLRDAAADGLPLAPAVDAYREVVRLAGAIPHDEGLMALDRVRLPDLAFLFDAVADVGLAGSRRTLSPEAVLWWSDRLVWIVLFIVASLTTLVALWGPNTTWGTQVDYLTALLVGFGITLTGRDATATTIDALWQQMTKPIA